MKSTNGIILIFILLTSISLRFFNYFDIPFTYDEFSAFFRLNFDSFSELIEKGVKIDGHPAGIHVFLYYWTMLFGSQVWIVKFPFTILGVLSVFLVYIIGKKWFNETVGLLSAAYLGSIQMTVMYSQIARPYISGLFFSLVLINYWTNLMKNPERDFNKNSLIFILSASLCAYNHHFSLLFAAMVGITGVFIVPRRFLPKYLFSGLVIFALYVPHLKIFFYQLAVGGVGGWLGKPHNDFLFEFIFYVFNFSPIVAGLALVIILFGLFHLNRNPQNLRMVALSFAWFIIPFLIGFYYSRYVNAVLQYSVLIFSLPLLFFALFGFIKEQSPKINMVLVSAILIANVTTLIFERRHFSIFYEDVYKQILIDYDKFRRSDGNAVYVINSHDRISNYYSSRLDIDTNYTKFPGSFQNILEFKHFLEIESEVKDKLFFGCRSSIHPNIVPIIKEYYPRIEIQHNYYGGMTYVFSKRSDRAESTIDYLSFDSYTSGTWNSVDTARIVSINDTVRKNVYLINGDLEQGPSISLSFEDVVKNQNNFIDISCEFSSNGILDEVFLVGLLESQGETVYWSTTDLSEYKLPEQGDSTWTMVHHSMKLSDIYLNFDDITLKIYIWNKGKRDFLLNDITIKLREGNPIIYGLIERI